MTWIARLMRSPTGFEGDPRGFAVNQILHALAVGAAPVWLLVHLPGLVRAVLPEWIAAHDLGLLLLTCAGWVAANAVWLVLAAFAVWEIRQFRRHGAEPWDNFEDWAYVAGGAALVAPSLPVAALVLLAFLISGYLRRRFTLPE
jgi:hypothetical protein